MTKISSIQGESLFKSCLSGRLQLTVVKVSDISKPLAKPVDDIQEPEEEEVARQARLDRGNARMLQLLLRDSDGAEINALETEKIDLLTNLKPDWILTINGPIEVRCGNLMLEKKHVAHVEQQIQQQQQQQQQDDDCIIID